MPPVRVHPCRSNRRSLDRRAVVARTAPSRRAARGVHGQTVYVDPKAEMVIARFASHPVAGNAAIDPTSLPAYHALARHLLAVPR